MEDDGNKSYKSPVRNQISTRGQSCGNFKRLIIAPFSFFQGRVSRTISRPILGSPTFKMWLVKYPSLASATAAGIANGVDSNRWLQIKDDGMHFAIFGGNEK